MAQQGIPVMLDATAFMQTACPSPWVGTLKVAAYHRSMVGHTPPCIIGDPELAWDHLLGVTRILLI